MSADTELLLLKVVITVCNVNKNDCIVMPTSNYAHTVAFLIKR